MPTNTKQQLCIKPTGFLVVRLIVGYNLLPKRTDVHGQTEYHFKCRLYRHVPFCLYFSKKSIFEVLNYISGWYPVLKTLEFWFFRPILIYFYRPHMSLWQDNVFSHVCLSVCSHGGPHVTTLYDAIGQL